MKIAPKLILCTTIPAAMVCAVGYYGATVSQAYLRTAIERKSVALAGSLMDEIDRSMHARTANWSAYGRSPHVQQALEASNRAFASMDDVQAYIDTQDDAWRNAPPDAPTPFIQSLLDTDVSRDLRTRLTALNQEHGHPVVGEVIITNRYGANVAQSGRTTDYRQDDEAWWREAKAHGVHIGTLSFDKSADMFSTDISVAIRDEAGTFAGVLKAVLSIEEARAILVQQERRLGASNVHGLELLDQGGQVIHRIENKQDAPEKPTSACHDLLAHDSRPEGTAVCDDGEWMYAFARSNGYHELSRLGWTVVLEQPTSSVLAPAAELRRDILLASVAATILAIVCGATMALSLSRRVHRLTSAVQSLGDKNAPTDVNVGGGDELAELAATYSQMATDLRRHTDELQAQAASAQRSNNWLVQEVAERMDAEHELEARERQQAAVAEFGLAALDDRPVDSLHELAVELTAQVLDANFVKVLVYEPGKRKLILQAGVGWRDSYIGAAFPVEPGTQELFTLNSSKPVVCENMAGETRFRPNLLLADHDIVSGMCVVIRSGDRPFGILGVHTDIERAFTEDERHFLQAMANVLASALERDDAKRMRQENEERLQAILDTVPAGILVVDPESHRVVDANPTALELIGSTADAIRDADCKALLCSRLDRPNDCSDPDTQTGADQEDTLTRPDGSVIPVIKRARPVRIRGKTHVLHSFHDISERKRAEGELAIFRQFAESSSQGLGWTDMEGRLQYANSALCTMFEEDGLARLRGRSVSLFYDEKTQKRLVEEVFPGALANGRWNGELDIVGAKGGVMPTLNSVFLMRDDTGAPMFYANLITDITDRKESEERLRQAHLETRQLLASIPSVLIGLDDADRIIAWNAAAESLFGIPAQDAIGQLLDDCGIVWESGGVLNSAAECRITGNTTRHREVVYQTCGGQEAWLDYVVSSMADHAGATGHVLIIASDISERKILEGQLTQAQKLESIGQLAAGIAHEINTPIQYVGDNTRFLRESVEDLMAVVDMYAGLLDPEHDAMSWDDRLAKANDTREDMDIEFLRDEIPKAFNQTLEGVDRVARIVRSMKEFSHPGGAEMQLADLNKAIESTVTVARNEWKYVADLTTELDPDLPPVPCFLGDFNQVVLNMIINAAHAIASALGEGNKERGLITITTKVIDDRAVVRISDTGAGIPDEYKARIFDPFFTTKEVGKGTGQGLAIAHNVIVKKHNGTLDCTSSAGEGTTFTIRLPLASSLVGADGGEEPFEMIH